MRRRTKRARRPSAGFVLPAARAFLAREELLSDCFPAGLVPQAPPWMQRAGLEWSYRLAREPRRLWRRYARYNPRFMTAFAAQYLRHRRQARR